MQVNTENIYILVVIAMLGSFLLVLLTIVLQIRTQNKVLAQKRQIAEAELTHQQALIRTFIVSQENERKRIGMDLHDEVGTALSSLRMHIEMVADTGFKKDTKTQIDTIIRSVRNISHNLSPFLKGAYGLLDALEDLVEGLNRTGGINASINFNGMEDFDFLNDDSKLALYRVLSELINNTLKHAAATALSVQFKLGNAQLHISYSDNGKGITAPQKKQQGIGLMNIESRVRMMNATCAMPAMPGKGFSMEILIPV